MASLIGTSRQERRKRLHTPLEATSDVEEKACLLEQFGNGSGLGCAVHPAPCRTGGRSDREWKRVHVGALYRTADRLTQPCYIERDCSAKKAKLASPSSKGKHLPGKNGTSGRCGHAA